jgi:hypothetical protein
VTSCLRCTSGHVARRDANEITSASCKRARRSVFIPKPPMLIPQQKCVANIGVCASEHSGARRSYDIPCRAHRRIRDISVTGVAKIALVKNSPRCEGAQPKQTFVTSFSFHSKLVRNIDVSHTPTRSVDCITPDSRYAFLFVSYKDV